MTTSTTQQYGEFAVKVSDEPLGFNLAQQLGRLLWLPMWLMAVMAFPVAFILGAVRAGLAASGTTVQDAAAVAALGQYVPAVMFLGFASAFAAIAFAIARILGVLRSGGGAVQQTAERRVVTLAMPWTAWGMIILMAMGMMALLATVVVHVILGINVQAAVLAGDATAIGTVSTWAVWIEGVRRFGVAVYLASIALGLGTIVTVLRFQSIRVRDLPGEPQTTRSAA